VTVTAFTRRDYDFSMSTNLRGQAPKPSRSIKPRTGPVMATVIRRPRLKERLATRCRSSGPMPTRVSSDRDHHTGFPAGLWSTLWRNHARVGILTGLGAALTWTTAPRMVNLSAVGKRFRHGSGGPHLVGDDRRQLVGQQHYDIHLRPGAPQRQAARSLPRSPFGRTGSVVVIFELPLLGFFDMSRNDVETEERVGPTQLDQMRVSSRAVIGVDHQRAFLPQHFREPLMRIMSGVSS